MALYDPAGGFYSSRGRPGRRGDFLTSPETGSLFAAVVARALDAWWGELGRPDPYVVVEAGAGPGTLAAGVLEAAPACAPALRYVLVERSEALRGEHARRLALEPPGWVLGPVVPAPGEADETWPLPGRGPMATSLAELPSVPVTGVVLANELLDDLPVVLLARAAGRGGGPGGWQEVRVGEEGGALVEVLVPAPPALAAEAERLAPEAPSGARIPLQRAAVAWLRAALGLVGRGRVVVVDYADTTPSLAVRPWPDWLRTYRAHARGGHPLAAPGTQDVTCEVTVDQLARVRPPALDRSQADFLRAHGLDDLVAEAAARWRSRAAVGDLAAVAARSRVTEAAALTDPGGLGGFRVLEWVQPPAPPLAGPRRS